MSEYISLQLETSLHKLNPKDRQFAESLLRGFATYGSFTSKQRWWVNKLIARASGAEEKGAKMTVPGGELVKFMHRAVSSKLKWPKVRLAAGSQPVVLSVAGERSKHAGAVNVTDGGPYGSNLWFGRINMDGSFTAGHKCTQDVADLLTKLAEKPAETAAAYGHMTGSCCFCGRELTDGRSVSVGYGPVCAGHYQLPWGEKPEQAAIQAEREEEPEPVRYVEDAGPTDTMPLEVGPASQATPVEVSLDDIINPKKSDKGYIPLEV